MSALHNLAWFRPTPYGGIPWPNLWPGWAILALAVVLFMTSFRIEDRTDGWIARAAVVGGYALIAYLTVYKGF